MGDRGRGRSGSRDRRDGRDFGRGGRDSRDRGRDGDTSSSLLVRNLSYRVSADEIRRIFSRYGDIRDVYIPLDYHSQRPRGFAFVEFYDKRDAMDAVDHLDRYEVDGRELAVVFAKDRRKTPEEMRPRGRGNSRDRRGGGGDRRGGRDSRDRNDRDRSRSRDRGDRGRNRDERDERDEPRSPSKERAAEPAAESDMNGTEEEHRGRSRSRSQHSN